MRTLETIGRFAILLVAVVTPYTMYREYIQAKPPKRRALIGVIAMTLFGLLTVLSLFLAPSLLPNVRNPRGLFIIPLDLQFLTYWWTSPSEAWTSRRRKRHNLIFLSALSVLLCIAFFFSLLG